MSRAGATIAGRSTPAGPLPRPGGRRLLRVALALAVVVAGLDGFLLWGRGLATPVGPELAAASYLTGRPPGDQLAGRLPLARDRAHLHPAHRDL
jgi:hypothetical protein